MKSWWLSREPREQWILGTGGVLALVILLWSMAWAPLTDQVSALQTDVDEQQENLAWMRQAAGEVIALRGRGGTTVAGLQGRSLLAVVDQSARQAGMGSALKRVEPDGNSKVRVRFEGVPFDALVVWLDQIRRQYGIQAVQASVETAGAAGLVTARLTLLATLG